MDDWVSFRAPASVGALVRGLRAELDRALAAKIEDPGLELTEVRAMDAVLQLLSTDGF